MPSNTVKVARPTIWGNPYWDLKRYGLELCLRVFRDTAQGIWSPSNFDDAPEAHRERWMDWMYQDHLAFLRRLGRHPIEAARQELRGKNLACFCPLDVPCHADVLLEIANR
jgi:hypothetical protein